MHRCSIVACARWETDCIYEWLAYHSAIGFDHVFLHCNDDDPLALLAEVRRFMERRPGFVTFTHFPGQGQQRAMYLDSMRTAQTQTEWLMFLDLDEFLVLRGVDDVNAFVEARAEAADSISFNWLVFGNNGFVERPCGPVLSNYTRRAPAVHPNTKHLTRAAKLEMPRLEISGYPFWHALNGELWSDVRKTDVLGHPGPAAVEDPAKSDALIATAVINHYMLKSEKDFLLRAARGTGGDFIGQSMWQRHYESGEHRAILDSINKAEDRYLADFSINHLQSDQGRSMKPPLPADLPTAPIRTVPVRHKLWTDSVVLGANNRARHASHGSLGTYIAADDLLYVKWDTWPADLFFECQGIYTARELLPAIPFDLKAKQQVAIGNRQAELRGVLLGVPDSDKIVEIRPATSDVDVFAAVFLEHEYDIASLVGPVQTIVDLGANTGLAAMFFTLRYPGARVIAVEPELANYQILCRNTRDLGTVEAVHAAIWSDDTTLSVETTDQAGARLADWGFQTKDVPAGPNAQRVEALGMQSLLHRFNLHRVDLLKVDIEGAEHELFGPFAARWLPKVQNVLIETHERFRPGSDRRVTDALAADFEEKPSRGENRVFVRREHGD